MKQNKAEKLLAGALAVSLAMGVNLMPAFAADDVNCPPAVRDMETVTITKNYELTNPGTTSPAETFAFTIERDDVTDAADGVTAGNMPLPSIGDVTYARGEAGSATKSKLITITLPRYDSVGIYTYIIHEVAGSSAGVAYFGDDILLRVTVIEQDGKIRVAAVHTEDPDSGEDKKDYFDNVYSAGELNIHKDIEGNMGDKSKYFEFTVSLTGTAGKTYAESYAVTGGSSGANNPASVEILPGQTKEYTFRLKDGDTVKLENLPYGVEYAVSETPAAGYETTSEGAEGEVDEAVETATFTNTKNGEIDTGIVLDNAPYLLTLTAAAGAGLFITLRRRHQK